MIIVRSPLRITLGGGGSDIPAYYEKHGGFCVAAAIDKYVYVAITTPFYPDIFLKYSQIEHVRSIDDIQNTRIRECLKFIAPVPIEITSLADIPAGTGLGSSSSFTVALLCALSVYMHNPYDRETLAEMACHIEMDTLREPIGKQDQYIAAHGGLSMIRIDDAGHVDISSLQLQRERLYELEDNLLLFFTGIQRETAANIRVPDYDARSAGFDAVSALEDGNVGEMLNEQWSRKPNAYPEIAEWRKIGLRNGAEGCKLVGAGGGGFLLFYSHDHSRLRKAMKECGLEECRFRFDFEGTKVLMS